MAVTVTALSAEPRSFSIGPVKMQLFSVSAASGDTSISITASSMHKLDQVILTGFTMSAISISGNTATITVADPLASVVGQAICIGK